MTFNHYNHFNILHDVSLEAQKYIDLNKRNSLNKLIETYDDLGISIIYNGFISREPLFHYAILQKRDDMVIDLYKASPSTIKQYIYKTDLDNLIVAADILGNAVINKRHDLVEKLLDLKGKYKLNIDGIKNTSNIILNFYHIMDRGSSQFPFVTNQLSRYISSPLMLSLLIHDFEMYEILKKRGAYFNPKDKNCKFHLDYCKNEKIKEDIYKSF